MRESASVAVSLRTSLIVGLGAALVALPLAVTTPEVGLDGSWRLGLSLAAQQGLHFGTDVVFSYGPLGFLAEPNLVYPLGVALGIVYGLLIMWSFCTATFFFIRRLVPSTAAIGMTAAIAIAWPPHAVPELAVASAALWLLAVLTAGCITPQRLPWFFAGLGAMGALQLLVKFSTGAAIVAMLVATALAHRPNRTKSALFALAGLSFGFVALWVAARQPLGAVGTWLARSADLSAGYSDAMALRGSRTVIVYFLLSGLVGALAISVVFARRVWTAWIAPAALIAITAWAVLKEGFVRADGVHSPAAFLTLLVLFLACCPAYVRHWVLAGCVTMTAAGYIVAGGGLQAPKVVIHGRAAAAFEIVASGRALIDANYREHRLDAARREGVAEYGEVPATIRPRLEHAGVDADPYQVLGIWANRLPWHPVPVFQTYAAFTPSLDHLNATTLRSPTGPGAVVSFDRKTDDNRNPDWESPEYEVALACNFEETAAQGDARVFERRSDLCGDAVPLSEVTVRAGEQIDVPSARQAGDLVVMTVDVDVRTVDRIATLAFKPRSEPHVQVDGEDFRFVLGTARQQHLVSRPDRIGARRLPNGALQCRTVRFSGMATPITVRFLEVRTASAG